MRDTRTDDEYPSPTGQPSLTIHLGDRVSQKATESATKSSRTKKESQTLLYLITLVPPDRKSSGPLYLWRETRGCGDVHGDEVEASWIDAGLTQAQEETSDEEPTVVLHEALSHGDGSESNHTCGN